MNQTGKPCESNEPCDSKTPFCLADLAYDLPADRIAQHPLPNREDSRMLIVDRKTGELHDALIVDLPNYLQADDLLVMNDTKVLPARLNLNRATGGRVGGLFLEELEPMIWRVMLEGSRRLKVSEKLSDAQQTVSVELLAYEGEGVWRVEVVDQTGRNTGDIDLESTLERIGSTPLPPYIRRSDSTSDDDALDRERYQTVYAKRVGAIAAPTAGLHLTGELLDKIKSLGVATAYVTLHVGAGTFKPISVDRLEDHPMHEEWYEIDEATASAVNHCRGLGGQGQGQGRGRVVAIGTTSIRVLESAAAKPLDNADKQTTLNHLQPKSGMTDLFIYPPYSFRVVDVLLTNFHLPNSTLLALVMALAGKDFVRRAYQHAIEKEYRFFSYGDAMLIV